MGEFICGFELHLPLSCESKLFCACPVSFKSGEPNTSTCPICLGHPGSKPALNKRAVDYALRFAIALNCKVEKEIVFSRKAYFYPDLAKNYQISQYDVPLGRGGFIELSNGKKVRIRRVHLEEDPGALVHEAGVHSSGYVLVDYNRSGVPLCEIVTEPDIESVQEADEFIEKLGRIVSYLGIFDSSKGVIKADTNISIKGGERIEVKNVTGSKNIKSAIAYELKRQKDMLDSSEKITMETRGFDEATLSTYLLRKKESEADYGFIVDADLVPTIIDERWLEQVKKSIPELSEEKAKRFARQYNLKEYDASVLAAERGIADIFEHAAKIDVSIATRIVSRELLGILNYNSLNLSDTKVDGAGIAGLVALLRDGKVSDKNAKQSVIKYVLDNIEPEEYLRKNNLLIESSAGELEKAVQDVIAQNNAAFEEFKAGNSKSLNFIIGAVMRKMKGKADARVVQKMLEEMK